MSYDDKLRFHSLHIVFKVDDDVVVENILPQIRSIFGCTLVRIGFVVPEFVI